MFKNVANIGDIKPFVAAKPEIKWARHTNGATVGCYMFQDKDTFDSPEALECRGIAFDDQGRVLSRPLHKFFNVGERGEAIGLVDRAQMREVYAVYEKLDGSIISTSKLPDGGWALRSRKSYTSDVVGIANDLILPAQTGSDEWGLAHFCKLVTEEGFTACFELTSPDAQIVMPQQRTLLRLLHVRDNFSGEYVMMDLDHPVWGWIATFDVPLCPVLLQNPDHGQIMDLLAQIEQDETREGVVIQYTDGDMVKLKTPWYLRLHKSISFMRERDIAELALLGELDDVRVNLQAVGIDTFEVDTIERTVKNKLLDMDSEVNVALKNDGNLDRKTFAIKYKDHQYFGLMMAGYTGKEIDFASFYRKHRLDQDFTMRTLLPSAADDSPVSGGSEHGT
jgi:RNA ligase